MPQRDQRWHRLWVGKFYFEGLVQIRFLQFAL